MKMVRLLTGLMILAMMALAGCGTQSPDFTPKLHSIQITYTAIAPAPKATPTTIYAVGDKLQFIATALCTTPPGSASSTEACGVDVGAVTWSVDNSGYGTITSTGLFTVTGPTAPGASGTVTVTGKVNSLTNTGTVNTATKVINVTPAVLRTLVINPTSALVGQGDTQPFSVTGVNSDGSVATLNPTKINWTSSNTAVATVSPAAAIATGAKAIALSGTSNITAATTNANGDAVSVTAVLTVSNATLKSLAGVNLSPASAAVPVGGTQAYQLMGVYSDGVTRAVPNAKITWTVDNSAIATLAVVAGDNKATATGVAVGLATVTATLIDSSALTDPTKKSATGTLTVVDAFCTTPLTTVQPAPAPAATTTTAVAGGICIGCTVDNPGNVIDADPTNFATLNPLINLLGGNLTLTVNSNAATPFLAGQTAGFVIGRPAAALLSVDVLSNLTITTYLGGVQQESLSESAATTLPPLLRLTLLGLLGSNQQALLAITTTKDYDAISITYNGGLATALSQTLVYNACSTIDLTKAPK